MDSLGHQQSQQSQSQSQEKKKPWIATYERNREAIKKRNLERYYAKRGRTGPVQKPPPPPSDDAAKRIKELVEELRILLPKAMKPKRTKKRETATAPDPLVQTFPDPLVQTFPDPLVQTFPDPLVQTFPDLPSLVENIIIYEPEALEVKGDFIVEMTPNRV
jgi:hypothetical protein